MPLVRRAAASAVVAIIFVLASFSRPAVADVAGLVRGTLTAGGVPQSGAVVAVTGAGGSFSTSTDASGHFAFARVPFGRYTVTARAGENSATRAIDVQSDAVVDVPLELDLRPIGRTATGAARGPASEPVAVTTISRTQIAASPENESLNRLVETIPGIVRFSYDEPVAHGFHGITYELDGIPLPRGTASNFSEVADPRDIDTLEVFTGAFPAEYGGSRQGAVVNLVTRRPSDLAADAGGLVTSGIGTNYGAGESSLFEPFKAGATTGFLSANLERTNRGIDSPTFDPLHDAADRANQSLRTVTRLGERDTLAVDVSNDVAHFQIPLSTAPGAAGSVVNAGGTDDVQSEYADAASFVYTHDAKDGSGYTQIAPWYRSDRVTYGGDPARDLAGSVANADGSTTPLQSLREDRRSVFDGLRITRFQTAGRHALKAGLDGQIENFRGSETILSLAADGSVGRFVDNAAQRGSQAGAYVEDKWTPSSALAIFGGLRFDRSSGYVAGAQLSPRIEADLRVTPNDVVHAYFGRLYAAPTLEDTRRAAVITAGGSADALPAYDLKPERDSYYEFGLAHQIAPNVRAYVNAWKRDAVDVLDTTQLAQTPIFAVFNNAIGIAKGIDARLEARWAGGDSLTASASLSKARAGGISGGTFLFCPPPATAGCSASNADVSLQPEDHDQTVSATIDYTKRFGRDRSFFASLEPQYGSGFPVQFQNGPGRLPTHLTVDASFGRSVRRTSDTRGLGFIATFANVTNDAYPVKINNGFNTTQWAPGFHAEFRLMAPL